MSASIAAADFRVSDYLQPLRRHWLAVLLCTILGLGGAVAYLYWTPKEYQATTAVLVNSPSSTTSRATTVNLETESQLVTATSTALAAADKLHERGLAATLLKSVSVTVPANSEI